jgi:LPS export ABC transporter protein LptC/lipopolysaccharide transport protein LptA
MKQARLILGIVAILIAVGIVGALIFRDTGEEEEPAITEEMSKPAKDRATIEATGLKHTESKDGKVILEIEAGNAEFYKDEERTTFDKIMVTFFYKEEYQLKLRGDTGSLNNKTKNIVIKDNVVVSFAEEYKLETDTLNYSTKTDEITTDSPIVASGPEMNFTGKGLTFNLAKEELHVHSNVVADLTKNGDEEKKNKDKKKEEKKDSIGGFDTVSSLDSPLHIRSGNFYGNRTGSYIRFGKGAHVTYEGATLTAGAITVYLDGENGGVSKIVAVGNVKLKQKEMTATCGKLVFDYKNNKLSLTRNPVVWRGDDMVKGDTITYDLTTNKSIVTSNEKNRAHLTIYPKEEEF